MGTITRNRKSRLVLNEQFKVLLEKAIVNERKPDELARSVQSQIDGVTYVNGIGWQLEPYQLDISYSHERTETDNYVITADHANLDFKAAIPTGFEKIPTYRKPSELTGVLTGANANLSTTGDYFYNKAVGAGDDWSTDAVYRFVADQTSFGGGTGNTENIKLDRVFLSYFNSQLGDAFTLRFILPGTVNASPGVFAIWYFVGVAGKTRNTTPGATDPFYTGIGKYGLALRGDGIAVLYEYDATNTPIQRDSWRWCEAGQVFSGKQHQIYLQIGKHKIYREENASTLTRQAILYFKTTTSSIEGSTKSKNRKGINRSVEVDDKASTSHIYIVPKVDNIYPPTIGNGNWPIRLDVRRDLKVKWQFARAKYKTSGTLKDDIIDLKTYLTDKKNLKVHWWGDENSAAGYYLDGHIYDAETNTELTLVSFDPDNNVREYAVTPGLRYIYALYTFITSDQTKTPTLVGHKVTRDGADATPTRTTIKGKGKIQEISIIGPERDPSHESATIVVEDLLDELSILRTNVSIPVYVDTTYDAVPPAVIDWNDPANDSKRSILVKGYTGKVTAYDRGASIDRKGVERVYPSPNWRKYDIEILPMWLRIHEALNQQRVNLFAYDDTAIGDKTVGWKVTDAISFLFQQAGYHINDLDLPNLDARLYAGDNTQDLYIDVFANVDEYILKICSDYTGYWITYDANAGTNGLFRMLPPTVPPYNNLAKFYTDYNDASPAAGKILTSNSLGYDTVDGQVVQKIWIVRGSFTSWVIKPEFNKLIVSCVPVSSQVKEESNLTLVWHNYESYNFAGLPEEHPHYPDPTNPDYLDRIIEAVYLDPMIRSYETLATIQARLIAVAGHAIKCVKFEAPLILVTDKNDSKQTRPRPLRYYDPVLLDGEQFLVRDVNILNTRGEKQMAVYELESPREPFN